MHLVAVWSGRRTNGGKKPEQLQSPISSLEWPHTSQEINTLRDVTACSHSLLWGCPAYYTFYSIFYENCSYSIIHLWLIHIQGGKSTAAPSQMLPSSSCPRHFFATFVRSAVWGESPYLLLWPVDTKLLSHPRCSRVALRIALDYVCAKFYFVYVCQC